MAHRFREPDRPTADDGCADIPYRAIADELFSTDRQRLIPFLGAGTSMTPPTPTPQPPETPRFPVHHRIAQVCNELNLSGTARIVFEVAACLAMQLQRAQNTTNADTCGDPVRR